MYRTSGNELQQPNMFCVWHLSQAGFRIYSLRRMPAARNIELISLKTVRQALVLLFAVGQ